MTQFGDGTARFRVATPGDLPVPTDGSKSGARAAAHEARHGLEAGIARNLGELLGRRRVRTPHGQEKQLLQPNACILKAARCNRCRCQTRTSNEQIDPRTDAALSQCLDLHDDALELEAMFRIVKGEVDLVWT